MSWTGIGNALATAFAAALATFATTTQGGGSPEAAGTAAGTAFVIALIQHFRQPPK